MRADRLISLLLILQHSGRKTARELSEELEVSERTIYRDVIALSSAGVPVYTERGPGGGIRLVESYRTTLTGLSPDEVQALFMFSVPTAMMDLGVSDQFQQAFLKLSASLSSTQQQAEQRVRQRVLIDSGGREGLGTGERFSLLQQLYQAAWEDRVVDLTVNYYFGIQVVHTVEVYSLVARGNDWYLVGRVGENFRVFGFFQIAGVERLENKFIRDQKFDLSQFWQKSGAQFSNDFSRYMVEMWVCPQLMELFSGQRDYSLMESSDMGCKKADWSLISTEYNSFEDALQKVLSYGGAAKVVWPEALRLSVQDYAEQILGMYGVEKNPAA